MKSRTKYLIIVISVIGFILLIFNSIKWRYWGLINLLTTKILYTIGFIAFIIYYRFKKKEKLLINIMFFSFSISLIFNVYLINTYLKREKSIAIKIKYENANCEKLKNYFETDLKNEEIKFFQYGIGIDIELYENLKSKYGIESIGMGCMKLPTIDCYNNLVNNYLIEIYNDSIVSGR